MKCKYCEKDLMEGAKFCVYCGKAIEVDEPKIVKPEVQEERQETISDPFGLPKQTKPEEVQPPIEQATIPKPEVQEEKQETIVDPFGALEQKTNDESQIQEIKQDDVNMDSVNTLEQPKVEPELAEIPQEPISVETKVEEIAQPLEEVKKEINVNVQSSNNTQSKEEPTPVEQTNNVEPTPIELPKEPEKQEIKVETKIVKKNNPILIVMIFILLAIILGGGFFVYTKYVAPSDNKKSSSQTTPTNNEVTEKEQDYDKETAKDLIDKYYYTGTSPDANLFTDGMTDSYKKYIAIKNLSTSDFQTTTANKKIVEYDVLNKKYQYLFGKDENVEKIDFEYLLSTWKYDASKDSFTLEEKVGGFISGPYFSTYGVQSAKVKGENLTINVGYVFLRPDDAVKISGEEVSYTEEEIQKEGFEKEFLDKYLDKLDTYEFTFKYEDDHYVFVDMKKV